MIIEFDPRKWFGPKYYDHDAEREKFLATAKAAPVDVAGQAVSTSAKAVESTMAITFKSVGHFFAKAYKAIVADLPKIEATKATVEKVTAQIPVYGPLAVSVEDAGYALLGEASNVLSAGGDAVAAKLADAGLDIDVIKTVQAVVAGVPQLVSVAKTL